ncbi:Hypothetical predicted protein [Olea europaea subsp. europaea]|uniref:Pentatricopeptide repeat-containing protein n=1 Tax=Olea europaea subsp. europaea TaxID=158383 RepID=A0A8S0RTW9_OLEEU|nr:Hypothetical predicted protein [Olea europaea subsp. europaea]
MSDHIVNDLTVKQCDLYCRRGVTTSAIYVYVYIHIHSYGYTEIQNLNGAITNAVLLQPIKRPFTIFSSIAPQYSEPENKKSSKLKVEEEGAPVKLGGVPTQAAFDQILLNKKWVSSNLSSLRLNTSKWKHLLTQLTPHHFDTIFLEIYHLIDPTIALKFFYFASAFAGFKFKLRSYCLLIHLLVSKNLDSAARFLLIRLIDKRVPMILNDNIDGSMHKEITVLLANLYSGLDKFNANIRTFDILVHVFASQFKSLGFDVAVVVFRLLASKGLFPSFKTSNFLLSSLIKADELEKCCEVFNIISSAILPDVYLFSTTINALCKGGKVNDAVMLFKKMEDVGIAPNVVTYNNLLHGLCKKGNLEEAFQLKEKMLNNGVTQAL